MAARWQIIYLARRFQHFCSLNYFFFDGESKYDLFINFHIIFWFYFFRINMYFWWPLRKCYNSRFLPYTIVRFMWVLSQYVNTYLYNPSWNNIKPVIHIRIIFITGNERNFQIVCLQIFMRPNIVVYLISFLLLLCFRVGINMEDTALPGYLSDAVIQ